jgi:hypothetical protein
MKNLKTGKNVKDNITENIKSITIKDIPFWLVGGIFSLFTIIFFWDNLVGNNYFWEDFIEYVFPVQTFAAREFAKFSIPFWNPYSFSGMPFLADLQVGFFYPLNRVLSLFIDFNGNLPFQALQYVVILHFIIAQISMYFLAKHLKISSIGAIISAIGYAFSMILICHVIHPMIVYHLAWFPLIIKFYYKGVNKEHLQSSVIGGLLFGMTLLSGHPQTTLYEGLFLGFLFIWLLVNKIIKRNEIKPNYLKLIPAGIIPVLIGFGIFAIQYFPSKELADNSVRNEINYEKSIEGSLEFKQFYTSIIPNLFGSVDGESMNPQTSDKKPTFYLDFGKGQVQNHFYWETAYYFGVLTLIFGLFGALFLYKDKVGTFLIFISIFGFLYALGDNSFIYKIMYNFPMFGNFRNPGRILFFTIIGFSLLAGFGFDEIWKNYKNKWVLIKFGIAIFIPVIIALMASSGSLSYNNTPYELLDEIKSTGNFVLLISFIAFIAVFLANRYINPLYAGIIIILLSFTDLYLVGSKFNKGTIDPNKAYEINPEMKSLLSPKLPKEIFRVNTRVYKPVSFMAMKRNQGMIDKMMLIEGYNPLLLNRAILPLNDPKFALDFFNVKYKLEIDIQKGSWNFVPRDSIYPNAWFVSDYRVIDTKSIKDSIKQYNYDFHNLVLLEENPKLENSKSIDTATTSIECLNYTNNLLTYKVRASKSGFVVFNEINYPGWKAYIDGQPAELYKANYCFRAIPTTSGEHIIDMKFDSETFRLGYFISIGTLVLSIIALVVLVVRKENQ